MQLNALTIQGLTTAATRVTMMTVEDLAEAAMIIVEAVGGGMTGTGTMIEIVGTVNAAENAAVIAVENVAVSVAVIAIVVATVERGTTTGGTEQWSDRNYLAYLLFARPA